MKLTNKITQTFMLAASLSMAGISQAQTDLSYAIGATGGSNYPIGVAITQVLNSANVPGLGSVTTMPGGGAANVVGTHTGQMDMGMVFSAMVYDGFAANPPFNQVMDKSVPLFSLHPFNLIILVPENSDINSFADLRGKRVNIGPSGFSTAVIFNTLRELHGFSTSDLRMLNLGVADSIEQLKDGHIDALWYAATDWFGAFIELAQSKNIRFVEIDPELRAMLNAENTGYIKSTWPINQEIYRGLSPTETLAQINVTVVNPDVVDDELAYNIVKALAENFHRIQSVEQSLDLLDPSALATFPGGDFHPGAARYYREQGWIK